MMRVVVKKEDTPLTSTVTVIDPDKIINDYYYNKFYPSVRFPVDIDQIMY